MGVAWPASDKLLLPAALVFYTVGFMCATLVLYAGLLLRELPPACLLALLSQPSREIFLANFHEETPPDGLFHCPLEPLVDTNATPVLRH